METLGKRDRLTPVARFTNDVNILCGTEYCFESRADHSVVVDEQHPNQVT
ncbi:MAG: hypothetical protein O2973_04110 [Gemmatimonadetes bacterium]|nr:hypothetical protein [Gemmatimonadota bacterium]